jgi:hypothetical protein
LSNENNDDFDDDFEYEGIFDDLTPQDFARDTSARIRAPRTNEFDAFVDEQIRAVRMAWIASETYMNPLALVANHDEQLVFIPDDDETLREFVARMHREAVKMGAIWTFVAQRCMVTSLGHDDGSYDGDLDDPEVIEKAMADGTLVLGVQWYAERREGGERQQRHGQLHDENGTLGALREGAPLQRVPLFPEILGG